MAELRLKASRRPRQMPRFQELETRLDRIHMLHQKLEIHERYLLHPRLLDVLEALIGPDLLAMQTMLFLKGPGAQGQGYHQDSYYIPTLPGFALRGVGGAGPR